MDINKHDRYYYINCFYAGLFPCGLTHTLLTPLDVVKCRRQIYPTQYTSLADGLNKIWNEKGVRGLYLGWQPTVLGYGIQGSAKYGLYELMKDIYVKIFGIKFTEKHQTMRYLSSSAFAEIIADCLLCPMESLKVRMQTSHLGTFPTTLVAAFKELSKEGTHGFYKGLLPLIFRQVPNTMIKFATYENTVKFLYTKVLKNPKMDYSKSIQLSITFVSGYIAGVFCCFFSNPADTIVSKLNYAKTDRSLSLLKTVKNIYNEIGFFGLWRGFSTRVIIVGTLSALEWLIYDTFKVMAGLETTGGK